MEENDKEEEDDEEEHVSDERLRPAPLYMMTGGCMMAEQQRGRLLCARTFPSQVFSKRTSSARMSGACGSLDTENLLERFEQDARIATPT